MRLASTTFKNRQVLSILFAGCLLFAAQAGGTLIDFEDLAIGTTLSNQYTGLGVTFSPNTFSGPGTSTSGEDWATNTDMTIVSSTGSDVGGLGSPSLVSGHLLRSFAGWLNEDGDPSFRANFLTSISSFSADFAGVSTGADVRLFLFNGATLLATVAGASTGQFTLSFSAPTITSVAISPGSFNDWVGVDNIRFTPNVTAVPEPETLLLVALGLMGLGLSRRKIAVR